MNNQPKNKFHPGFGLIFIVFVVYPWAAGIVKNWGYIPYRGWGVGITFALLAGFLLAAFAIDYLLFKVGFSRPIRSGLWLGAILGPYAGLAAEHTWGNPIVSQVSAILATIACFSLGYFLERRAQKGR